MDAHPKAGLTMHSIPSLTASSHKPVLIAAHLDLKGLLFRPQYLPQYLKDLAGQGVNTVLVEYEAVFPFTTVDVADDAASVWSPETLNRFLAAAASLGLEIVPLQQCLGHLEYVLGWERYRPFALDAAYPSTLDLARAEGKSLVLGMLREVLEAHPASRYVHLGLDEAFSLAELARTEGLDVIDVIIDYLEELCEICESYGKTPIIWSDMLEDHITPESLARFRRFKDRVILCFWDYHATDRPTPVIRLQGNRVSREWLQDCGNPQAPPLLGRQRWVEDLPAATRHLIEPYRDGRFFQSLFQADLWTSLGFRVLGASACRISRDGPVLPYYHLRAQNIRAWSGAIRRTRQLGQVATSWARGTSWCPPNCPFDLCWPLIGELSRSMGAVAVPFFEGIEDKTVERLFGTLGRSRDDWSCEEKVADEMEALRPQVKSHHYEWQSVILMARLLALHRRADLALREVEDFHAAVRPVDTEWERRLQDQAEIIAQLHASRETVRHHFSERYHGKAFEEWLDSLFALPIARLQACRAACERKRDSARRNYARNSRSLSASLPTN